MNRDKFIELIKIATGDDDAVGIAVNEFMADDQTIEVLARVADKHPNTVRQELEDADWPK